MKKKDIIKDSNDFNSIIKNAKKVSNDGFVIYHNNGVGLTYQQLEKRYLDLFNKIKEI